MPDGDAEIVTNLWDNWYGNTHYDEGLTDSALAIYIGKSMLGNLETAIQNNVWGCPVPQNAELDKGDLILFCGGVPKGPRQLEEDWNTKSASFLVLGRATSSWFEDPTPVWNGPESYPYRFNFELIKRFEDVPLQSGVNLSPEASNALRLSGQIRQNGGIQCQRFGVGGIYFYNRPIITGNSSFSFANFKGDYDTPTNSTARAEQRELRKRLLSRGKTCAICGDNFQENLLVAAHIKKRSECTDKEKGDLNNIAMLACKLGATLCMNLVT